jgi:hypothetical protein
VGGDLEFFHVRRWVLRCCLSLLMVSFHHGFDLGEGQDFGTVFSVASCIIVVRKAAALSRFVLLL